jgi:membrane-associated phospholipid phosphatase
VIDPRAARSDPLLLRAATLVSLTLACTVACSDGPTGPTRDVDPDAGSWRTWVLANAAEIRPAAPPAPGSAQATAEIEEIIRLQAARTAESDSLIQVWEGLPTTPWHTLALDLSGFYWVLLPDVRIATPARSARTFALLHVAMYDALVATWDAKYVYNRAPPVRVDRRVRTLAPITHAPSYPSEHAAAAAAAAGVLSYLFPAEDTLAFHALAREAGESRIAAGAAYRSDVDAGYAIGRTVAARAIARARADGSAAAWTGTVPTGETAWRPTPSRFVSEPFDPTAGSWRTWVIPSGSAFRPEAPPLPGSDVFERDVQELLALSQTRTAEQANIARFWASESPSARWEVFIQEEIDRRRLGPMRAARALALASVATYDAMVACWDAKYAYWLMRPVTADPAIKTVFSTPPFPSYPSGHSTLSSAVAEVFAELFPDAAAHYRHKGEEASLSRVFAGVHYRFDVLVGEALGRRVGEAVVAWGRSDGSE